MLRNTSRINIFYTTVDRLVILDSHYNILKEEHKMKYNEKPNLKIIWLIIFCSLIKDGLEHIQNTPDSDNIAKIIHELDSLNKIAFDDDSQVIELTVLKKYTEELERVKFELEEIGIG